MKGSAIVKGARRFASKHGSTVLTILSVIGVGVTAYLSSKAGKEADENLRRLKEDKIQKEADEKGESPDFSKVDDVQLTGKEKFACHLKAWWKPGIAIIATIGLGIGSHIVSMRQVSDWMATANVASTLHSKYVEKTKAVAGEEMEAEIRKQAGTSYADSRLSAIEKVVYTGSGDQLFFDVMNGRWFYSSVNAVERAIDMLNTEARNGGCDEDIIWMNDIYDVLGLAGTKLGAAVGVRVKTSRGERWDTIHADLTESHVNKDMGKSYITFQLKDTPDVFDNYRFETWG